MKNPFRKERIFPQRSTEKCLDATIYIESNKRGIFLIG